MINLLSLLLSSDLLVVALCALCIVLSAILAVRGIRRDRRRRRDEKFLERIRGEMERKSLDRQLQKRGFGRPGARRDHSALAFR